MDNNPGNVNNDGEEALKDGENESFIKKYVKESSLENGDKEEEAAASGDTETGGKLSGESLDQNADRSDYESFIKQSEENSPESVSPETENARPSEDEKSGKKKKKGGKVTVVFLIILIIALLGAIGFMIYSVLGAKFDPEKIVVTVDGVESNAAEYLEAYVDLSASFQQVGYQLTEDEIKEKTLDYIVSINRFYGAALKEGYKLTEEDAAEIDERMKQIEQSAESSSMTAEELVEQFYAEGITVDMMRESMEKTAIAQKYLDDNYKRIEDEVTANSSKKAEEEYNKNKADYDRCDALRFAAPSSSENPKETANAIVEKVKSGAGFEEAVKSVTGDDDSVITEMKYSKEDIDGFSEDASKWLFQMKDGKYVNGKGAVTVVEASNLTYVIYVVNEPSRSEIHLSTVDCLTVAVGTDTSVNTEEELKLAAESTAKKIFDEFNKGSKTKDAFTAVSNKYGDGSDSLVSAGTYTQVGSDNPENGKAPEVVEEWAAKEGRKTGDCEILEGEGYYYVAFLSEKSENPEWLDTILESLVSDAQSEWQESVAKTDDLTNVVTDDNAIGKILEYINKPAQSQ